MQNIIFYADDDDDLEFFKEVINDINATVSLFEEGNKMLDTLRNPPPKPSVIFLDLNMPVKSGFDILNEIKTTPAISDIPIVIFTTSVNPQDITRCKKMGATLYVQKPNTIAALKKVINFAISTDRAFFYRPI